MSELAEDLLERNKKTPIESIELVGLCTDICVVSNALLIKAFLPEHRSLWIPHVRQALRGKT